MKSYNSLYTSIENLDKWFETLDISNEKPCLIRIHTSSLNREQCVELSAHIKALLPTAIIVGCPVYAVIFNGEIYDKETIISVRQFELGEFKVHFGSTKGLNASEISNNIVEMCEDFEPSLAVLLFDNTHSYFTQIINDLNEKLPQINFVGGLAGVSTETVDVDSFLFDENGIYENAYCVSFVGKKFILTYSNLVTGHPPISEVFTITKAHDNYIDEIENQPATTWLSETFGIDHLSESKDWSSKSSSDILMRFPIVLDGDSPATRFLQYEENTNKLKLYYNQLQAGQKISIGYLSPLTSAENWQSICQDLQNISAESIFCYSCLLRKVFSNSIAKWEMDAFKNAGICGAFMYGEIGCKDNKNYYLNGSCSLFTLAEKESYIKPDLSSFDNIEAIIPTNDTLDEQIYELAQKLQHKTPIFNALIANEKELKSRLTINTKSSVQTMAQFLKRQEESPCKQIILVNVNLEQENSTFEDDAFNKRCLEIFNWVNNYITTTHPTLEFATYLCDNSHLAVVVDTKLDETKFSQIFTPLYNALESTLSEQDKELFGVYFTYNLNGLTLQKLIYCSCTTHPKPQHRFFHCTTNSSSFELNHEFKMVALLNEIIQKNSVIPYFQGIYDNQKNCFYAYESLMRLKTPAGKILFPGDFMDIAKKYDLYLPLSLCMVKNVFKLFENRTEIISLNISAYDVLSHEFQRTVFDLLAQAKHPENFIFELLETERFENLDILRNFVHRLKQFGCQIAVDDFGSGYANFIEFGNVETDFLKINGSLTKLLGTDASYDNILDSIAFMGQKMQVRLIAEFVETASTQKTLVQRGVHYSQGYLFSKPMPFAELKLVSNENQSKISATQGDKKQTNVISPLNIPNQKLATYVQFYGGLIVGLLTILTIVIFTQFSSTELEKTNDNFLLESSDALSNTTSIYASSTKRTLELASISVSNNFYDNDLRNAELNKLMPNTTAFELFVSIDGAPAIDYDGDELDIDINSLYGRLNGKTCEIIPAMVRENSGKLSLIFAVPVYQGDTKVGELYCLYDTTLFSYLLENTSFGGALFHNVFEIEGQPLYSGASTSNIFNNTNLYDFIDTLNISNGLNSQLVKEALLRNESSILDYYVDGAQRTAVISPADENWVIVSIVTNDVKNATLIVLQQGIILFVIAISTIFMLYFSTSIYLANLTKKQLIKALEVSHSLSCSLQTTIETDALTRTYTRATAIERINDIIKKPTPQPVTHALIILDVDNFKYINDNFGHSSGDVYLQNLVGAIKASIKSGNILGRLGGDEFVLFVDEISSKDELVDILDNIFINIKKIVMNNASLEEVSVCAGVVLCKTNETTYEDLSHKADLALYEAKRNGKDQYIFYDEV